MKNSARGKGKLNLPRDFFLGDFFCQGFLVIPSGSGDFQDSLCWELIPSFLCQAAPCFCLFVPEEGRINSFPKPRCRARPTERKEKKARSANSPAQPSNSSLQSHPEMGAAKSLPPCPGIWQSSSPCSVTRFLPYSHISSFPWLA